MIFTGCLRGLYCLLERITHATLYGINTLSLSFLSTAGVPLPAFLSKLWGFQRKSYIIIIKGTLRWFLGLDEFEKENLLVLTKLETGSSLKHCCFQSLVQQQACMLLVGFPTYFCSRQIKKCKINYSSGNIFSQGIMDIENFEEHLFCKLQVICLRLECSCLLDYFDHDLEP